MQQISAMAAWIGTSGWQYQHWDASFYPREVPKPGQLRFYAERFRVVEVNATFYKLPGPGILGAWAVQAPEDFIFVIKASKFLTHFKKLKDPEEPVERLMSRARELGPKMGPILLQLPPNMHCNEERLDAALALLAPQARVAVEFRHDSWYTESVREVLVRHGPPSASPTAAGRSPRSGGPPIGDICASMAAPPRPQAATPRRSSRTGPSGRRSSGARRRTSTPS